MENALNFRMYSKINKQSMVDEGPQSLYSKWMSVEFSLHENTKILMIILANQPDELDISVLQGQSMRELKPDVLDVHWIIIQMNGSVFGGFKLKQ